MRLRWFLSALLTIALFSLSRSASLSAGEQYGWVKGRYHGPVPYYVGNPKRIEPSQSARAAFAGSTISSSPLQQGDASPRAYPYGYFGAQYRPYSTWHRNYYNDYIQWSFSRGY